MRNRWPGREFPLGLQHMCALGPALSLAVLALEELAKLHAIDGLLFAKKDDHKVEIFKKSLRSHSENLLFWNGWPS